MVYYRELVGNKCESISGTTKWLRDRTSVKLEATIKAAKMLSVFTGKIIKHIKKR